jgi:predicted phosphodiesterase
MRIGIISDIHSDLLALEETLRVLSTRGYDKLVCLGDIIGYSYHYKEKLEGRNSDACVKLVKENCDKVIAGNHDIYWSLRLPDYLRKNKYPDNWYKLNLKERMNFSNNSIWLYDDEMDEPILADNINFLSSLPETYTMNCGSFSILFTHFLYPDLTGSSKFFPETIKNFRPHLKFMQSNKCLLGIAGHAHLQGYSITSKKHFRYNFFGKTMLDSIPQVILGPAVTRGDSKNGFMILDTEIPELEVIQI